MKHRSQNARSTARPRRRSAFTMIELLIVISVIVILLSLLIVGLNKATKAGQTANTQGVMKAVTQALTQFKSDIGYLPPVLDNRRDLPVSFKPRVMTGAGQTPNANLFMESQGWFSVTSLADYLIGYGNEQQDGYGDPDVPVNPAVGIRNPGVDGVWTATLNRPGGLPNTQGDGYLLNRNQGPGTGGAGKVYGPYLELDNERLIGSIDPDNATDANGRFIVHFPGQAGYDALDPKVICDYWGQPLEYFRRNYPGRDPAQRFNANINYDGSSVIDDADHPSLSIVVRLRPYSVAPGSEADSLFGDDTPIPPNGDTTTSIELETAEFAVFSPGPDLSYDPFDVQAGVVGRRVDPEEFNADNMVEVGK